MLIDKCLSTDDVCQQTLSWSCMYVCQQTKLVYKATVTAQDRDTKTYSGVAELELKTGYNNHNYSFKHKRHSSSTELQSQIHLGIEWSKRHQLFNQVGNSKACECLYRWFQELYLIPCRENFPFKRGQSIITQQKNRTYLQMLTRKQVLYKQRQKCFYLSTI